MTPNRWAQMVLKVNRAPFNDVPWIYAEDAVKLLLRQQAQFVRLVKRIADKNVREVGSTRYGMACDDILVALKRGWR